jgi:hypothetical protein
VKERWSSVPPDEPSAASRSLRWASEDLTLAEHAAADHDVVPRGACVWAHQAAEKALKGLLVARDIDPPRLHDLDRLVALLPEAEAGVFDRLDLPELTRWAIETISALMLVPSTRATASASMANASGRRTVVCRVVTAPSRGGVLP